MLTVNPKLSTYHKVLVKRSQFSDKLNYQSREKVCDTTAPHSGPLMQIQNKPNCLKEHWTHQSVNN